MQALQNALSPATWCSPFGPARHGRDASYEGPRLEIADGVVTTWVRAAVRSKVDAEPGAPVVANDEQSPRTAPVADVPDAPLS